MSFFAPVPMDVDHFYRARYEHPGASVRVLAALQRAHGIAMIPISHDLGVVAHLPHQVAVTYAGELVEVATA